jgi:hypothetical protein
MPIPDLWLTTDLKMLQLVVELQVNHNGTFSLEELIDKVGLLDRGDSYTGLTPWMVTESLRRLTDGGFVLFVKDSDDPETQVERVEIMDWMRFPREGEAKVQSWKRTKERRINEALFKGVPSRDSEDELSVAARWSGGRFFINGVQQLYSVRATPEGLRRVGAWPNPERFTEDLVAILGEIAESIEVKRPEDAKTLRQIGRVIRANAIELSAAVLAKLLEHAAGL